MSIPTIIKGRNCPTLEAVPHYDDPPSDYAGEVRRPKLMGVTYKIDGLEVSEEEYKRVKQQIGSQDEKPVRMKPNSLRIGKPGVGVEIEHAEGQIRITSHYDGGFELHTPVQMPLSEFLQALCITPNDIKEGKA